MALFGTVTDLLVADARDLKSAKNEELFLVVAEEIKIEPGADWKAGHSVSAKGQ